MPDMGIIDPFQEPKRKNRWVLEFVNAPELAGIELALKTAALPQVSFERHEVHRKNERYYVAGKPEYGTLEFSFYSFQGDLNDGGRLVYEWLKKIYDPSTDGDMGLKGPTSGAGYAVEATMNLQGPTGEVIESWRYRGMWPTEINYDGLDYSDSGPIMISVTCSIDKAIRQALNV